MTNRKPKRMEAGQAEFLACIDSLYNKKHKSIQETLTKIIKHIRLPSVRFGPPEAYALYPKALEEHYGDEATAVVQNLFSLDQNRQWDIKLILAGKRPVSDEQMLGQIAARYGFLPDEAEKLQALYPAYRDCLEKADKQAEPEQEEEAPAPDTLPQFLQAMLIKRVCKGPNIYLIGSKEPGARNVTQPLRVSNLQIDFSSIHRALIKDTVGPDDRKNTRYMESELTALLVRLKATEKETRDAMALLPSFTGAALQFPMSMVTGATAASHASGKATGAGKIETR